MIIHDKLGRNKLNLKGEDNINFRSKPKLLLAMPRLLARLPDHYSERSEFEQIYNRLKAGYTGERKVDRYLESLALPSSIKILKDLHLSLGEGHSFQIDTLIISEKFILILEIKNIAGDLYFDTNPNQLVRILAGSKTKMDCPVTQILNTKAYFEKWLAQRNLSQDVEGRIILANQNAYVHSASTEAEISFMKGIPLILQKKEQQSPIMNTNQLNKLVEMLKQNQVDYNPYPLCEYYRINPEILKTGQLCRTCNFPLSYINHKSRFCKKCGIKVPTDYESTLQDWFMIFSNSISNKQCRNFLRLEKGDHAKYALKSSNLNKIGESVATKYIWPSNKPFKVKTSYRVK